MMKPNDIRIQKLIEKLSTHLLNQLISDENGVLRFIDPNDKEEISAHYSVSHLAASLIILGNRMEENNYYSIGRKLLIGLLDRWEYEHRLYAYHFDFNNFALTLCFDNLIENDDLKERIKNIILKSPDSPHDTINWLPMRLIVNKRRFEWTSEAKYEENMKNCIKSINQATNHDGGIEDRLPKGISFNLQYDISTLATICFAYELMPNYDINAGFNFLLNNIAPDGDINYQGRGCNQIFAWGPWVYLLSSFGLNNKLKTALDYLEGRLIKMLNNNSMMLNDWPGSEKYLWWDYHYASVYSAHLLLWLILAQKDTNRLSDNFYLHHLNYQKTGLKNISTDDFFVSIFEGRSEYLAEQGPSVCLVWTKQNNIIFKGTFAPWRGLFGNKNTFEDIAMMNYFGLFIISRRSNIFIKKLCRKFFSNCNKEIAYNKKPLFCPIKIEYDKDSFSIIWTLKKEKEAYINIPSYSELSKFKLQVDGKDQQLYSIAKFRNQYDWINLNQSKLIKGSIWRLIIAL